MFAKDINKTDCWSPAGTNFTTPCETGDGLRKQTQKTVFSIMAKKTNPHLTFSYKFL